MFIKQTKKFTNMLCLQNKTKQNIYRQVIFTKQTQNSKFTNTLCLRNKNKNRTFTNMLCLQSKTKQNKFHMCTKQSKTECLQTRYIYQKKEKKITDKLCVHNKRQTPAKTPFHLFEIGSFRLCVKYPR